MDIKTTPASTGFSEIQNLSISKGVRPSQAQGYMQSVQNTRAEVLNKSQPELSASYSYNADANMFVVKILDEDRAEPNKTVKQIPPEYMLELAKENGKLRGNVVDISV